MQRRNGKAQTGHKLAAWGRAALLLALCCGLSACGSSGSTNPGGVLSHSGSPASQEPVADSGLNRTTAGFTLHVLGATFADGARARDVTLDVQPVADSTTEIAVSVVDAHALKGVYLELAFDPTQY